MTETYEEAAKRKGWQEDSDEEIIGDLRRKFFVRRGRGNPYTRHNLVITSCQDYWEELCRYHNIDRI